MSEREKKMIIIFIILGYARIQYTYIVWKNASVGKSSFNYEGKKHDSHYAARATDT